METGTRLFEGETALVTGSASNIGRAIATGLADEGAHVILADVDGRLNEEAAQAICAGGGSCRAIALDLAKSDGWTALRPLIAETVPSMFVHSACPVRRETDTVQTVSEETFDAMHAVNVRAAFFIGRMVSERMIAAAVAGRMLFITSLHARAPRNLPHYSAAKAALEMIMRELARDLAPYRIRANAIAPGALPGGGNTNVTEEFARKIPMQRVGTAADLVGPALALLSDRFTRYVTGTTLPVDGGLALYNWIPFADSHG